MSLEGQPLRLLGPDALARALQEDGDAQGADILGGEGQIHLQPLAYRVRGAQARLHGLLESLEIGALGVAVLLRVAVAAGLADGLRLLLLQYCHRGRRFLALDAPVLAVVLSLDLGDVEDRAGAEAGLLQLEGWWSRSAANYLQRRSRSYLCTAEKTRENKKRHPCCGDGAFELVEAAATTMI